MVSYATIQSFALEMQMSVDNLIQNFWKVGIVKTKFDVVTQTEKEILLKYVNSNKFSTFNKFSLQRKTRSTLNISSAGGKSKQVQIEVRKKRVYMVPSSVQEMDCALNRLSNNNENLSSKNRLQSKLIQSVLEDEKVDADSLLFSNITEKSHVDIKNSSETRLPSSVNKELKDLFYKNHIANEIKNLIYHGTDDHKSTLVDSKKDHDDNIVDGITVITPLKLKSDNKRKPGNEQRQQQSIRNRSRLRSAGKIIRQKRNNSRLYVDINEDSDQEKNRCVSARTNKNKRKQSTLVQGFNKPLQKISRDIVIGETISVLELSNKMSVKGSYMIKIMMKLGVIATINHVLDQETAQLIIEEMGHNAIVRRENSLEESIIRQHSNNDIENISDSKKNNCILYKNRAPIVTIMGHVDHGKTSLLDCIRSSKTIDSEYGGITQKIGAYSVKTENGMITFLDTPGHAAFSSMRIRGIQLTDIVVLVVAADDGVMPQTIESIKNVQSSKVPVIVAINKIDKLDINIDQVKNELSRYGLIPEEWGGHTQFINISAISGKGINNLLDAIILQSEMLKLKVMHFGTAKGVVVESSLDKGRGPVATILIREGILKCGDVVLCGIEYGRIRAMYDEFGNDITEAGPSIPVKILGLSGAPDAGEMMIVIQNERKVREVALYRKGKKREHELARKQRESNVLENVFSNIKNGVVKIPELYFIVKADTHGSVGAICESLKKLSTNEIKIKIISNSVGNIIESDFVLATASNAIILGFNVKSDFSVRRSGESSRLNIRYYSVIYDLLNDVKKMMNEILTPKCAQKVIGLAEVRSVFKFLKSGNIAGCIVTQGVIKSRRQVKVIRNDTVVYQGELESLRHFKSDVGEVKSGMECGIGIKNYNDICSGDIIEVLDIYE